jgi:transcriptional regulator with XRE-family HTH domain
MANSLLNSRPAGAADAPFPLEHADRLRENFADLLRYARLVLGKSGKLATKRELADAMSVAATMVGRYETGEFDFYGLRIVTIQKLAEVTGLDISTVVLWAEQGRDIALAHQESLSREPTAFSALDYLRKAVTLLEQQEMEEPAAALEPPNYELLLLDLKERRGPEGQPMASMFDSLVELLNARPVLERIEQRKPLLDADWSALRQLLPGEPAQLQQRYGFRTPARTAQQPS